MKNQNKISFSKVEQKYKKDIYSLFHPSEEMVIEKSAYSMLGLEEMDEDQLFERMISSKTELILKDNSQFVGLIETIPYKEDALEIRIASIIYEDANVKETEAATQKYIIKALKKHGAKRMILEVSKDNNLMIEHLLGSGYKVISTINNSITFEFDFSKFNK
ncbi:hypothetical protein STIUS_v1c06790 [Spiroplasma sp. TIUS-1]|uniref:hypothetical protein n=1 Tax=Spiroplasma sp. TIUS-1 TaxID=216963 RepID=UPI0013979BE3|nr:hypothetical protein [Spiroplasma sp. TIUS-1]QHX36233.1 hypothetical protein STIUS_v1c06790 [Spiroplasma sp. TIUS-1]